MFLLAFVSSARRNCKTLYKNHVCVFKVSSQEEDRRTKVFASKIHSFLSLEKFWKLVCSWVFQLYEKVEWTLPTSRSIIKSSHYLTFLYNGFYFCLKPFDFYLVLQIEYKNRFESQAWREIFFMKFRNIIKTWTGKCWNTHVNW